MRQTMARGSGFAATLRRRWWIFPIVLVLVAAGLVLRALTAGLPPYDLQAIQRRAATALPKPP